jgi:hypothetical protein
MTSYRTLLVGALDRHVAPALAQIGFARLTPVAWGEGQLQVRAIVDSKAADPYRGGAFTLEFEVSDDGKFEEKLAGRVRLDQLLDETQRKAFLEARNAFARRLNVPPSDHMAMIPESVRKEYLKPFSEVQELEKRFWMRFITSEDLDAWCGLVVKALPSVVERAQSLSAHELYMGRPLRW